MLVVLSYCILFLVVLSYIVTIHPKNTLQCCVIGTHCVHCFEEMFILIA
jgi:uncharacterized MnhB-related membrane protein